MKKIIIAISLILTGICCVRPGVVDAFDRELYEAQKKLEELGYDPGTPDGIRGKKTVNAIKLFQQDSGLPDSGKLDAQTKDKLKNQSAPPQFSLNDAVHFNDIVLIKGLIDAGADVNRKDKLGETPLHVAVVEGYKEIASMLIENGADVNAGDIRGLTPLHAAAWRGYRDIVILLIANGADINARDKDALTPLHTAALAGREQTVVLLIEKGADVNTKNKNDLSPLHAAALTGDKETVALLINKGADVNARSDSGMTPLQMASQKNHWEVVELLQNPQPQSP